MLLKKNVPMSFIEFLSEERSSRLYVQHKALGCSNPGTSDDPVQMHAEAVAQTIDNGTTPKPSELNPELKRFLRIFLSLKDPFHCQGDLFRIAGITSGSAQARMKRELIRNGMVREHKLQARRGFLSIPEPTERAYNAVGIEKPQYPSKGGWLHQFCNSHVRATATADGYSVDTEFMLTNGKSVDQVHRKPSELIFVEIAMSYPMEKEITNVVKDFATDLQPDQLVVAVKDGKMKGTLEQLIEKEETVQAVRDRVKVVLSGNFVTLTGRVSA